MMFEFTNAGIKAADGAPVLPAQAVVNAGDAIRALKHHTEQHKAEVGELAPHANETTGRRPRSGEPAKAAPPAVLTGRSLVRQLRARLREVEREIKARIRLENEAAQLRRLIAAAKAPPARVTDITTARKSG